jgi:hypothetical protein
MASDASSSLLSLEHWIDSNGYSGYDPYDIKGIPTITNLSRLGNKSFSMSVLREVVFEFFYTFPVFSRHLFQIKPETNAKAMGLFASSYLDLYNVLKEETYYEKSLYCLNWLKKNKSTTYSGDGWGYPFNWQTKILVPAGTPNGIVTTVAGEAFWRHYKLGGEKESLDYCVRICEFLTTLPFDRINNEQLCFSYTPLFINHVHNLNLFVAEFLIKTGIETSNNSWIEMGNLAVNYTISNQLDNGSFDYSGPPEILNNHIDNYHTGFVLRMLHSIWKHTGRKDVLAALNKCYLHYISNFFINGRIPKLMANKKYRIDIHSCAESIHCLSELSATFPGALDLAENILHWTLENLQDKSGYFYYGILKSRFTGIPFVSKIPYIRWGQAWMHKALSSYIVATSKKKP